MEQWEELKPILDGFHRTLSLTLEQTTCKHEISIMSKFFTHITVLKKDYKVVTRQDVEGYVYLQQWKPHTRYHAVYSIKRFYDYLKDKRLVEHNPAEDIAISAKKERTLVMVPAVEKISRILHRMEKDMSMEGLRNRLMVELAYGSGLRRTEIATINMDDIDINNQTVFVLGKGRKERVVPLTSRCMEAYQEYIRNKKAHGKPLFVTVMNRRINPGVVGNIIKQKTGYNPHLFRHAFATHMLINGCNVRIIQELLGHERIDTTQVYTHLHKEELRKVINRIHPARLRSCGGSYVVTIRKQKS